MFLGLDLGTSSLKALVLDVDGAIVGSASAPYGVSTPEPGWAEADPEAWWDAAGIAVAEAAAGHANDIAAVGLSGQMHGVVLSDDAGQPVRPAILWADTRSRSELAMYSELSSDAQRRLANPPAAGMAGPTLLWLRQHERQHYRRAQWALQPKDWLRLRLILEAATEPSDASATLLYDMTTDYWATDVIEALDLRMDFLAPIRESVEICGVMTTAAARHLGLRPNLPVVGGAADTAAAALAGGLFDPGPVQLTVGTGAQVVAPRDRLAVDATARTHLYRAAAPDHWYGMAAMQNAGIALEWVRKTLSVTWDELYGEAFAVPPGADGLVFLPYLTGERTPYFDPNAKGAWVGLQLEHGRGHLLRAALEGVAFAVRQGFEALLATGVTAKQLRLAGGGSFDPRWRQLVADVLEQPLYATPTTAVSALGAALLAGVGFGTWPDAQQVAVLAAPPIQVAAPSDASERYLEPYRRFRELYLPLAAALT
ncbi:MAG TPA: xylulokinase [Candidatus Dormibacteraeota bacterium]|nr:xylulokinase [Candidatus Dormibacteraeota bacterium]